jgi:hypothetical protein
MDGSPPKEHETTNTDEYVPAIRRHELIPVDEEPRGDKPQDSGAARPIHLESAKPHDVEISNFRHGTFPTAKYRKSIQLIQIEVNALPQKKSRRLVYYQSALLRPQGRAFSAPPDTAEKIARKKAAAAQM